MTFDDWRWDEWIRCAICRYPGDEVYCSDTVACNYRARRRLGIPREVCEDWRERDRAERGPGRGRTERPEEAA